MTVIQSCAAATKLHIAIPCYTGFPSASTLISCCGGTSELLKHGIVWSMEVIVGNPYLDDVRNVLATNFLKQTDATDLLFVDADIGCPAENFVRIAQATRPVVGGVPPKKTDDLAFAVGFEGDSVSADDDGYVSPDYLPTAFLRINRTVFEQMQVGQYEDIEGRVWNEYFECPRRLWKGRRMRMGEDFNFCDRWRSLGGRIHMIPDLSFVHVGIKTYQGNWAEAMLR